MRNRKNNPQSSERRKEDNNSDAPRKYGRKNFRPKSDATIANINPFPRRVAIMLNTKGGSPRLT